MFANLYLYNTRNRSPIDAYLFFTNMLEEINITPKHYGATLPLSPEKSDHPGDFKSKKIRKNDLEAGLRNGSITSFSISNKSSTIAPDITAIYFNDKKYAGVDSVTIHMPCEGENLDIDSIFDRCALQFLPEYGFKNFTDDAADGILYLGSSCLYDWEFDDFSNYLKNNPSIRKIRLVYPVNYLSAAQLSNNELTQALKAQEEMQELQKMSDDLWRWMVSEEKLQKFNQALGTKQLLATWSPEE